MINSEKAKFFLSNPAFPINSKILLSCNHKVIAESLEISQLMSDCLIQKIRDLAVGKTLKNEIEDLVDFNSKQSICEFFKNKIKVKEVINLDANNDIADIVFELEIYYGNRDQITEKIIEELNSITFKTFFTEVKIN